MHAPFLFRFGYCTPEQWTANEKHGWDDESSGAFFVIAEDEVQALEWACTIANAFVDHLFTSAERPQPQSWREAQFAYWLDDDPKTVAAIEESNTLPRVRFGETPNFDEWQPY